jgi:adenylate cyclase
MTTPPTESPLDRRPVGIVFTDIVGSTVQLHQVGTPLWVPLQTAHFRQLERLVSQFSGLLVETKGDGSLSLFPRATDAVLFARAAVTDPGGERIALRASVHWGYVTKNPTASLLAGRAIHFAARIIGLVTAVGLCVSDDAKHQIEAESPDMATEIEWTPLDNCELKGIPGLHRVWLE